MADSIHFTLVRAPVLFRNVARTKISQSLVFPLGDVFQLFWIERSRRTEKKITSSFAVHDDMNPVLCDIIIQYLKVKEVDIWYVQRYITKADFTFSGFLILAFAQMNQN